MTAIQLFRTFHLLVAALLLGWGIAYGYLNYQGDQCTLAFDDRNQSLQVRIKSLQARIDSLISHTGVAPKGINTPQ